MAAYFLHKAGRTQNLTYACNDVIYIIDVGCKLKCSITIPKTKYMYKFF